MIALYLGLFVSLIFILNFLRHQISQSIQIISLLIFRKSTVGVIFYSLFFLPGVIIHELSHLLFASLLGVPTGTISIFPQEIKPGNMKLGYVESAASDPVREGLIGFAPLMTGVVIIFVVGAIHEMFDPIKQLLLLYLLFSVANTMFVSQEDTRSWWGLLTLIIFIAIFIYVFQLSDWLSIYLPSIINFFSKLDNILLILAVVDVTALALLSVIQSVLQRLTGLAVRPR